MFHLIIASIFKFNTRFELIKIGLEILIRTMHFVSYIIHNIKDYLKLFCLTNFSTLVI